MSRWDSACLVPGGRQTCRRERPGPGDRCLARDALCPAPPSVAFVVAYQADDQSRVRNWAWVKAQLASDFPDWPIVEELGSSPDWNKQRAINKAIARADADIVVIYDSDCFLPAVDLRQLVALAQGPARWAMPTRMVRLTRAATRRVLAVPAVPGIPTITADDHELIHLRLENVFNEVRMPSLEPLGVIQLSALREVGVLDDWPLQFQEFWSALAIETLIGPAAIAAVDVFHLMHPLREFDHPGARKGALRWLQYQLAYGDRDSMAELVACEDLDEPTKRRLVERWEVPAEVIGSRLVRALLIQADQAGVLVDAAPSTL